MLFVALAPCAHADSADATSSDDQRVWELTSYLKGTASQIRDLLNGDVERLIRDRREAKQEILDTAEKLKKAQADAMDRLHASPREIALRQALEAADQKRVALREDGVTSQARLDAAATFLKVKQELDKYEHDALAGDEDLQHAQAAAEAAQERLVHCESSLVRAWEWRQHLLEAVRNGFLLQWPLRPGDKGLIGTVTPTEVDKSHDAIAFAFQAMQTMRQEKMEEEIATLRVLVHPVNMIARDVDIGGLAVGKPVTLDRAFEVVGQRRAGSNEDYRPVVIVRRSPDKMDHLFEMMGQLREEIDPAELAALKEKATPRKAHPKTWDSLAAIIAAAPKKSHDPEGGTDGVAAMNDWLDAQIVGDRLDTYVELDDSASPAAAAETKELHGSVRSQSGTEHTVICQLGTADPKKLAALKPGQKIHVSGIIRIARAESAESLFVELADVHL